VVGPPPTPTDEWHRDEPPEPRRRPPSTRRTRPRLVVAVDDRHLADLSPAQRRRLLERLGEAAADYEAEHYADARRTLSGLVAQHPTVAEVRELAGLANYRLGRWTDALADLEAFGELTGSTEQHPVRMDCARALGRSAEVDRLWAELRDASPDAAVVTEGRIVVAAMDADAGRLDAAIRTLEAGPVRTRAPKPHHLRLWYALADLYERSGDVGRARRGFERVARLEPEFADVRDRLAAIS
jgi:predicted Zn-dependent protease